MSLAEEIAVAIADGDAANIHRHDPKEVYDRLLDALRRLEAKIDAKPYPTKVVEYVEPFPQQSMPLIRGEP